MPAHIWPKLTNCIKLAHGNLGSRCFTRNPDLTIIQQLVGAAHQVGAGELHTVPLLAGNF